MGPASAVLDDLQGALPIRGVRIVATVMDSDFNGLTLGLAEPSRTSGDLSQLPDDLAETAVAWGQARPPCPRHPHPARPVIRDAEAWWICESDNALLYRVGNAEVPTRLQPPPSWHPTESRRARKRRHQQ
jgi:hypothetical protein